MFNPDTMYYSGMVSTIRVSPDGKSFVITTRVAGKEYKDKKPITDVITFNREFIGFTNEGRFDNPFSE